jgi:hypothetical protein
LVSVGNDAAKLQRLKLGTSTGEALAELPFSPTGMVLQNDVVFLSNSTATTDRIYRMPIAGGGGLTPVASFKRGDLAGYAPNGNALYVTLQLGSAQPLLRVNLP